jgi:hypothetical protein
MSRRRKELSVISEEEEREKPLKANVRRAYRGDLDRLLQLALSVPKRGWDSNPRTPLRSPLISS